MTIRWEWCLRKGIGLGCVLGLLYLLVGSVISAMNYDELVTTMLPAVSPSDFVTAFFKLLPYGLLGLIIFGTIYKLFRPQPPTGGPPV